MPSLVESAAIIFFILFLFTLINHITYKDSKEECKTNYSRLIETQAECLSTYPNICSATGPSGNSDNSDSSGNSDNSDSSGNSDNSDPNPSNQEQACSEIECNGYNRIKKSESEINEIPSSTSISEYSDSTFRSPCCKWYNLPDPIEGTKTTIDYTDFLNTTEACQIDDSDENITTYISAGANENGGHLCGSFTIQANADSSTPRELLTDDGKFEIKFIHDNPNRNETPSFRCPTRCTCPVFDSGQYWWIHNWDWGNSNAKMRCQNFT